MFTLDVTAPTVMSHPAGNGVFQPPQPDNEPVLTYAPGSLEKLALKTELERMSGEVIQVPVIVGGKERHTGSLGDIRMPHHHRHLLGQYHRAGAAEVEQAIEDALKVQPLWAAMPWADRLAIFLRAAELLAGPWRDRVNAATMLGQSKTVHQAEIDAACELIDFLRFNAFYASRLFAEQPESASGVWNRMDHRPLEGFVLAITPFNFTAIAGNLPTSPAMLGNVVLWKPASSALYAAHIVMEVLREAGLPPGVINFLPGKGPDIGAAALASPHLAGLHFTGSSATFQHLWKSIGQNLESYRTYPTIVGETGGKDFVVAHSSAEVESLATALVRGAFEYQGQKCSAASRAYLPRSLWPELKRRLLSTVAELKMGDVADFRTFMGAVIDGKAFDSIESYIKLARDSAEYEILTGGGCDASEGYFIEPTVVVADDPQATLMKEEIFGPVLTVFVYDDDDYQSVLALCDQTSPYALTGAVFARDREAILLAANRLRNAAGNFYVNDKPTGSIVNQQPFGGARGSGTNDKAGSVMNLMRWLSPRVIKENFDPPRDYRYPSMTQR